MKRYFLIMLMILIMTFASFAGCPGTAAAEDVNVDEMSNEQLMLLLQQIMQKLEQDETKSSPESPEPVSETPVPTAGPVITDPTEEPPQFQVYTNKKLIVGNMPAAYFIRKIENTDSESDESESAPKPKMDPAQCEHYCAYESGCMWGDNICYFKCYYPCVGEPYPDWFKPYL